MSAACPLKHCRGALDIEVVRGGHVVTVCQRCERRKAGLCRDCPKKVYGTVGKAMRCEWCAKQTKREHARRWMADPDNRAKKNAGYRARTKTQESRAKRAANRRAWCAKNPEKVKRHHRNFLLREGRARENYLAYHRKRNADPVAGQKKRDHALRRYYELHPERPSPMCKGCGGALPYLGTGVPPRWCDDCCNPTERSRRKRFGRSIRCVTVPTQAMRRAS